MQKVEKDVYNAGFKPLLCNDKYIEYIRSINAAGQYSAEEIKTALTILLYCTCVGPNGDISANAEESLTIVGLSVIGCNGNTFIIMDDKAEQSRVVFHDIMPPKTCIGKYNEVFGGECVAPFNILSFEAMFMRSHAAEKRVSQMNSALTLKCALQRDCAYLAKVALKHINELPLTDEERRDLIGKLNNNATINGAVDTVSRKLLEMVDRPHVFKFYYSFYDAVSLFKQIGSKKKELLEIIKNYIQPLHCSDPIRKICDNFIHNSKKIKEVELFIIARIIGIGSGKFEFLRSRPQLGEHSLTCDGLSFPFNDKDYTEFGKKDHFEFLKEEGSYNISDDVISLEGI
jgi:hypothetical protein